MRRLTLEQMQLDRSGVFARMRPGARLRRAPQLRSSTFAFPENRLMRFDAFLTACVGAPLMPAAVPAVPLACVPNEEAGRLGVVDTTGRGVGGHRRRRQATQHRPLARPSHRPYRREEIERDPAHQRVHVSNGNDGNDGSMSVTGTERKDKPADIAVGRLPWGRSDPQATGRA